VDSYPGALALPRIANRVFPVIKTWKKHHLLHPIPIFKRNAPKQQQIVLLPAHKKRVGQDKKRLQVILAL